MLLRELEITNFGVFKDQHLFDFSPRGASSTQNVVLFGGKNGCGKTTILEALRLCLYGRLALGMRVSQAEYDGYLRGRLHRIRKTGQRAFNARLTLKLDYAARGEQRAYEIMRAWTAGEDDQVTEYFRVCVDGEELDDVGQTHWEEFVEDLIPLGVSQLFFFDGEKIKSLADDASSEAELAEAMASMLDLDLVERLRADLEYHMRRVLKSTAGAQSQAELETLESEEERLASAVALAQRSVEEADSNMLMAESNLATVERELRARGGSFAEDLAANKARQAELEVQRESLEAETRRLMEGPYPFAYCPGLSERLLRQLHDEEEEGRNALLRDQLEQVADEFASEVSTNPAFKAVSRDVTDGMTELVQRLVGAKVSPRKEGHTAIHCVSERESRHLEQLVLRAGDVRREQAAELRSRLNHLDLDSETVSRALALAPKEGVLDDVLEQLKVANSSVAAASTRQESALSELSDAEGQLTKVRRRLAVVREAVESRAQLDRRVELARRTVNAMEDYQERLTRTKLQRLEKRIVSRFAELARKEGLVDGVRIDPTTFAVELIGDDGSILDRKELSAGEKQIYAVATLWGLADVSGRSLPAVIDTPLGRLDSEHRMSLVSRYFPHVSHQVVILSTDTEIDEHLYQHLEPHVARAYLLESDSVERCTRVTEGYFWKQGAGA